MRMTMFQRWRIEASNRPRHEVDEYELLRRVRVDVPVPTFRRPFTALQRGMVGDLRVETFVDARGHPGVQLGLEDKAICLDRSGMRDLAHLLAGMGVL